MRDRQAVIAACVTLPITATTTLVFAACMGLLWLSAVPLTSSLVAVMFGLRYTANFLGIVCLGHPPGAFLGAWLGAWAFATLASYTAVWWSGVALALLAAVIHLPIREKPVARLQPA